MKCFTALKRLLAHRNSFNPLGLGRSCDDPHLTNEKTEAQIVEASILS